MNASESSTFRVVVKQTRAELRGSQLGEKLRVMFQVDPIPHTFDGYAVFVLNTAGPTMLNRLLSLAFFLKDFSFGIERIGRAAQTRKMLPRECNSIVGLDRSKHALPAVAQLELDARNVPQIAHLLKQTEAMGEEQLQNLTASQLWNASDDTERRLKLVCQLFTLIASTSRRAIRAIPSDPLLKACRDFFYSSVPSEDFAGVGVGVFLDAEKGSADKAAAAGAPAGVVFMRSSGDDEIARQQDELRLPRLGTFRWGVQTIGVPEDQFSKLRPAPANSRYAVAPTSQTGYGTITGIIRNSDGDYGVTAGHVIWNWQSNSFYSHVVVDHKLCSGPVPVDQRRSRMPKHNLLEAADVTIFGPAQFANQVPLLQAPYKSPFLSAGREVEFVNCATSGTKPSLIVTAVQAALTPKTLYGELCTFSVLLLCKPVTAIGDSGSLVVDSETKQAIAMHTGKMNYEHEGKAAVWSFCQPLQTLHNLNLFADYAAIA